MLFRKLLVHIDKTNLAKDGCLAMIETTTKKNSELQVGNKLSTLLFSLILFMIQQLLMNIVPLTLAYHEIPIFVP